MVMISESFLLNASISIKIPPVKPPSVFLKPRLFMRKGISSVSFESKGNSDNLIGERCS